MDRPPAESIAAQVRQALAEDLGNGDLTAALVPSQTEVQARVVVREDAVLCGSDWFDEVFHQLDPAVSLAWSARDGDRLQAGQAVCELRGKARPILSGERTALNFLQTLSGTASAAAAYVAAVAGTGATILDTRKTIPGLRLAQKYAVRCRGAFNHRTDLFDAVLIKENHLAAVGGIEAAVEALHTAPADLLAWFGPAISQRAFEVGGEVRDAFCTVSAEAAAAFEQNERGRWQADIYLLGRQQLAAAGVLAVFGGGLCTHSDPARFYSYRRDGSTGRMLSFVYKAA